MKSLLSIIILIGFVGLGVLGAYGMHMQMDNHQGACIAATAMGGDCPKQNNLLDSVTFHVSAFKDFSVATFGQNLLASLLILFVLALLGVGAYKILVLLSRLEGWEFFNSPPKLSLISWLSLHENSPSLFGAPV